MMKMVLFFILTMNALSFVKASEQALTGDEELIQKTALDYGDGFYSGAAERMERALHPDLRKTAPMRLRAGGKVVLYESTVSGLVEMTRAGMGKLSEDKRKLELKTLKVDDDLACVRLKSSRFNDYLLMLHNNEGWKIVNVLWTNGIDVPNRVLEPGFQSENQQEAIRGRVRDYIDGFLGGDSGKMNNALHPEFSLANCRELPGNPVTVVNRVGIGMLLESVRLKLQPFQPEEQTHDMQILDVMNGLAFVRVETPLMMVYLQLAYCHDEWLVVNSLHRPKGQRGK